MSTQLARLALAALLPWCQWVCAQQSVVVIGHAALDKLDAATLQRVFTGRVVELGGIVVTPVNVSMGSPIRTRFLQTYLNQDDEKYLAYWTVRRYIGKGAPPREFTSTSEVIRYVQSTPGAIGYVDEASLTPGLNVLAR